MNVQQNIREIKKSIPENIRVVAISNFHDVKEILKAYETGHKLFGVSRV